jgi:SAM-dependent methyltransferase
MLSNPIYKDWVEDFSNHFLNDNYDILVGYGSRWVKDPLHTWSRGWEYTFVASAIRHNAPRDRDLVVLDVGSGVTFIDWMIAYEILGANTRLRVLALDSNTEYQDWFDQINKRISLKARRGQYQMKYAVPKVQFVHHDVQKKVPIENKSVDIVLCVSVMEHVPDTVSAIRNIFDTLVTGGFLIITFDIDINSAIVDHSPIKADTLLQELRRLGTEIYYHNDIMPTYNGAPFNDGIAKKTDLFTLHTGSDRGLDNSSWISSRSSTVKKGLFFSCHVFQKLP